MLVEPGDLFEAIEITQHRFTNASASTPDLGLVRALIDRNPSHVSTRSPVPPRDTPLHRAAFHNLHEVIALLLEHGADAEAHNDCGWTPLDIICGSTHPWIVPAVELLLRAGAKAFRPERHGNQPLDLAVTNRSPEESRQVVGLLRSHGAPMSLWAAVRLTDLPSVLQLTSLSPTDWGAPEITHQQIIESSIDPLSFETDNANAAQILQTILESGVNPNQTDAEGWTALHRACVCRCSREVIAILLPHIKDVNATTVDDRTPLDICLADQYRAHGVMELLLARGARGGAGRSSWSALDE